MSSQRDDRARGPLLHAFVDPRVHLGHELFEVRLRGYDLLIHRIRLDALERAIVLLDLLARGFPALLRRAFDILSEPLDLGHELLTARVLAHPLARPDQRLVPLALPLQPAELPRLLVDHPRTLTSTPGRTRATFSRASEAASRERSTAMTRSKAPSTASASARQPHPVPTSATTPRGPGSWPRAPGPAHLSTRSTSPSVSGRGMSARGSRVRSSVRKATRPTA